LLVVHGRDVLRSSIAFAFASTVASGEGTTPTEARVRDGDAELFVLGGITIDK